MRLDSEIADWFRNRSRRRRDRPDGLSAAAGGGAGQAEAELATMQDRLLNAYLAGTVEEDVYKAKSNELKAEAPKADEAVAQLGDVDPARGETALRIFDWTQNAAERWRGSNNADPARDTSIRFV